MTGFDTHDFVIVAQSMNEDETVRIELQHSSSDGMRRSSGESILRSAGTNGLAALLSQRSQNSKDCFLVVQQRLFSPFVLCQQGRFPESFHCVDDVLFRDPRRRLVLLRPSVEATKGGGRRLVASEIKGDHFLRFLCSELHVCVTLNAAKECPF
jgi:hypothetical protein